MFRIFAIAIFVAGLLIGGYYRYQAEKAGEKISWNEEGAIVMILLRFFGLLGWGSVIVYLVNPEWMKWAEMPLPAVARWIGVITGVIAVPLLYWLFKSIGKNITQTVKTRKEHKLVTKGPYRWVRHPLYSVGTLLFTSFALMASNWFIGLTTLIGLVMLMVRLPKEEKNLVEKFGEEYKEYMKRTGRLIPRIRANSLAK
ncbi:MAG: isoprenylcysteine carboxylmethyltransferase family protein [Acidobacteria bacterium]|nr:isoprenylcysteine carboxylmethyltransferase family protein [Acidobacteriota bacterium]